MKNTQDKTEFSHCTELSHRTIRSKRIPAALTSLFLTSLSLAALAPAVQATPATADAAITHALTSKSQTGWIGVIVHTATPLTPAQESQMTALGADIVRRLPIIRSVAVRVPQRSLARLAALPFASHLSLDGKVQKADEFTTGSSGNVSEYTQNSTASLAGTLVPTGQGVTVAVVDSGIAPSKDLSLPLYSKDYGWNLQTPTSRIVASINFVRDGSADQLKTVGVALGILTGGDGGGPSLLGLPLDGDAKKNNLYDLCGHGTHVAGIIAGNGARSTGNHFYRTFTGVAPQSKLVNVRVLDQNGASDVGTVISGLQWIFNNKDTYNIRVVKCHSAIRSARAT